jgi:putative SOS response-associated peptidase YedK
MCYSALVKQDLKYLQEHFGAYIRREQWDQYESLHAAEPKKFPSLWPRIFPGHYAPVLFWSEHHRRLESALMRYGAYPKADIKNPGRYTTYNARWDNIQSPFWSEAYQIHHGFIQIDAFYEWVTVKDLLQDGQTTRDQIRHIFENQMLKRQQEALAAGKPYRPTATEKKNDLERSIIIAFKPADASEELLVPVIFSYDATNPLQCYAGFAIVTDDALPDVSKAGHDRTPIFLNRESVDVWMQPYLYPQNKMTQEILKRRRPRFVHQLTG